MARARMAVVVAVALLTGCVGDDEAAQQPLLVGAASDLLPAFGALGDSFESTTGHEVVFSFGSSGQLAQQIVEGAPMDVFAAADASYVDVVVDAGRADESSRTTYATGRVVLWSSASAWEGWESLRAAVTDPEVDTVAIANPEHAPYGRAAREALTSAGLWPQARPKLVYGENIADTQRLASSGNADVALIALSLALAADERGEGRWLSLDEELWAPLHQDLVVVTDDPARAEVAQRFVDHVTSAQGRRVMERYGFRPPGER